jgi:hypothetical protein
MIPFGSPALFMIQIESFDHEPIVSGLSATRKFAGRNARIAGDTPVIQKNAFQWIENSSISDSAIWRAHWGIASAPAGLLD